VIYFTADPHFAHKHVCRICARPWPQEDNDAQLIRRWNAVVTAKDTVYVLGDFSFAGSKIYWASILEQLNGVIYLLEGNHDRKALARFRKECANEILIPKKQDGNSVVILPLPQIEMRVENYPVTINHYPMRSWNGLCHGTYHLFGHVHGRLDWEDIGLSVDVGVDNPRWNYAPASWAQVQAYMEKEKQRIEERKNGQ